MADKRQETLSSGAFESLQARASQFRRARPPDLDFQCEGKVPLRAEGERMQRRRSTIGLRSIFGRHKLPDLDEAGSPTRDNAPRPGSIIRSSLADLSHWPHMRRPDTAMPMPTSTHPPARSPSADPHLKHKKSASTVRGQSQPPRSSRGSLATWDPPPLFQAYPQAIRHATLPVCTMSVEAILRLHNHKGSVSLREGLNPSSLTLDSVDGSAAEQSGKVGWRHRRDLSTSSSFKFDWTTKIYVLVTSGYLLQYASEGSFDRLPEKILQLGKDSAAFATDLIPGCHWVLQVSSVAGAEGLATPHKTSLLSRLPLRGSEKRQASNFLMVFENADDMDSWIATMRHEIEALGGKKNLSETGKPKVDEQIHQIRSQASQRTLVVRDPERFSRVPVHDLPWDQAAALGISQDAADSDFGGAQSFDDGSTASVISQDGRQLDRLRDSANRLSFISSGQRTVITSAGSSPAGSPVREEFESISLEKMPSWGRAALQEAQLQLSTRPNAAAINERRQSIQTTNHIFDVRATTAATATTTTTTITTTTTTMAADTTPTSSRPQTACSTSWLLESSPSHTPPGKSASSASSASSVAPNSGVIHAASKRNPFIGSSSPEQPLRPPSPLSQRTHLPRSARRPPPAALSINPRPLSFVQDLPSPASPDGDMPSSPSRHMNLEKKHVAGNSPHMSSLASSRANAIEVTVRSSPRRYTSLESFRTTQRFYQGDQRTEVRATRLPHSRAASDVSVLVERPSRSRSKSGMGTNAPDKLPAPASGYQQQQQQQQQQQTQQRASLNAQPRDGNLSRRSDTATWLSSRANLDSVPLHHGRLQHQTSLMPSSIPVRSAPRLSASSQQLRTADSADPGANADAGSCAPARPPRERRSMSQLAEGPPPGPPPTCALPPIPRKFGRARGVTE